MSWNSVWHNVVMPYWIYRSPLGYGDRWSKCSLPALPCMTHSVRAGFRWPPWPFDALLHAGFNWLVTRGSWVKTCGGPGPSSSMTSSNHLIALDPASAERWADHRRTHGVTGPGPRKESGSRVARHVVAPDLTSTRRQGRMLLDMWRLRPQPRPWPNMWF
jgi:hypothetical protein